MVCPNAPVSLPPRRDRDGPVIASTARVGFGFPSVRAVCVTGGHEHGTFWAGGGSRLPVNAGRWRRGEGRCVRPRGEHSDRGRGCEVVRRVRGRARRAETRWAIWASRHAGKHRRAEGRCPPALLHGWWHCDPPLAGPGAHLGRAKDARAEPGGAVASGLLLPPIAAAAEERGYPLVVHLLGLSAGEQAAVLRPQLLPSHRQRRGDVERAVLHDANHAVHDLPQR